MLFEGLHDLWVHIDENPGHEEADKFPVRWDWGKCEVCKEDIMVGDVTEHVCFGPYDEDPFPM